MNALDSPLEALAFNYLSFAFSTALNNIWAFVAVATAAVSFWKIRAASPAKSSQRPDHHRRINEPGSAVSTAAAAVNFVLEETDGCCSNEGRRRLRRGKFTVYYDESGGEEEQEEGDSTVADVHGEEECKWGGDWKRGLRMRNGEDLSLGWYRYQDLTVLDGNVVRLWDGDVDCGGREFNQLVTAVW